MTARAAVPCSTCGRELARGVTFNVNEMMKLCFTAFAPRDEDAERDCHNFRDSSGVYALDAAAPLPLLALPEPSPPAALEPAEVVRLMERRDREDARGVTFDKTPLTGADAERDRAAIAAGMNELREIRETIAPHLETEGESTAHCVERLVTTIDDWRRQAEEQEGARHSEGEIAGAETSKLQRQLDELTELAAAAVERGKDAEVVVKGVRAADGYMNVGSLYGDEEFAGAMSRLCKGLDAD